VLVTLVAIGIFVGRIVLRAVRVDWSAADSARYMAAATVFIPVALGIFLVVVGLVIANPDEPLPFNILTANDHATFVGVITNLLFALAVALSASQRGLGAWSDQLVFWAMNAGLLVFLAGLIAEATVLKQIGAPVMGSAILLGLVVLAARLRGAELGAGTAIQAEPSQS
jgi:predicted membrane protein